MEQSFVIGDWFNQNLSKLSKTDDPKKLVSRLNRFVHSTYNGNVRLAVSTYDTWHLSGYYDPNKDKILLEYHCSNLLRTLTFTPRRTFDFNCTLQHELIHRWQYLKRVNEESPKPIKFEDNEDCNPRQTYLSGPDEIECQAHDLAMEIKYFYPSDDPTTVLTKYLSDAKSLPQSLPTLNSYIREFGVRNPILNQLLKKTYSWLPRT